MMDQVLHRHLEPVARDRVRWERARAWTRGWLALALIGIAFLIVHGMTGRVPAWVFLGLAVGGVGWTAAVWLHSRRRPLDVAAVARQLEAEHPALHALLLTAVEQRPDPRTHELNFLQERLIREALNQDQGREWHGAIRRRMDAERFAGAVTFLLLVGVLVPLYRAAPPRRAVLQMVGGGVVVTPGNTSLEKGSSLVVLAKFEGAVPKGATLVLRPANQPERRIPLIRNLDDPIFGASVPQVNDTLTYRVEHDGKSTPSYQVSVFEFPRLERADARVTYPAYTALPEKMIEDTRRISAVEGSALEYTFHLNKPVQSATLVAKDATRVTLQVETNRPSVYGLRMPLEKSARYELVLVDEAGRTNRLPPQFVLEALTNRVPDLKYVFPRGDQRVSALEEIAFQAEATDDFGLQAYGLAYNLAGQEPAVVEVGRNAGPKEKRAFQHLLALESLGALPDQLLSYYLWADDIGPDGQPRRTVSDMFFAEVRPFDEIFREGQPQDPNQAQQQQQQQQGQQGENGAERLAELQKQIITATWNLQRRETRKTPTAAFKPDATTVKESQDKALEQLRTRMEEVEDPRQAALMENAAREMEQAAVRLGRAADDNTPATLPAALSAEQAAYQALLRLAERESQVSQGQGNQRGQSSRGSRAQRQLNQLNLRQTENRYETERQAAPPQDPQQREQIQAFSRLKELAQRQQDVNERLRELQTALQEAKTEAEREELRAQLKRLQEEQQQMLADVDELRQRMDSQENQAPSSAQREQLDQTRSDVRRAAEAMERGDVPQALSSGTRAQQDLQQMRDEVRRQNSSQFAEEMRSLRNQARELARNQEDIGRSLDTLAEPTTRKALTDSDERQSLATQLDSQKERLEQLVKEATDVTQKSEPVEPLLSRQLYDTLRQAAQDDPRNLQDTADELLAQGKLLRSVYDRLRTGKEESKKAVEVTANLLRDGFPAEANTLEERARRSIDGLKTGMERAAESVLGDDTEALRRARSEVEELARQLEEEMAQARTSGNTNEVGAQASVRGERGARQGQPREQSEGQRGQGAQGQQPGEQQPGEAQASERQGRQPQDGQQAGQQPGGQQQGGEQPGQQPGGQQPGGQRPGDAQSGGQRGGQGQEGQPGQRQGGQQPGGAQDGARPGGDRQAGGRRGGGGNFLDQLGGANNGGAWNGPLTGPEFTRWSDRLRDVEEMLDVPELRAEAARIRDRARTVRLDLKRHAQEPQWDLVNLQIAGPLVELRTRIGEELAKRESREAVVPIDRDPVPARYAERVRRYYEQLGKNE